jgi:hypothetical protein
MENKSRQELEATLETYREQQRQVEELREQTPDDQSFAKLQADLDEAVSLIESLISLKKAAEEAEHEEITSGPVFAVNDYCYGLFEGLWYVAKVTKVNVPAEKTEDVEATQIIDYYVRYVGYNNTAILNFEKRNIKKYFDPPKELLQQGTRVLAVYDTDQVFYDAVIDTVTENQSVWVTFSGFGNVQETPLPLIRLVENTDIYQPNYKQNATGTKRKVEATSVTEQPPKKKSKHSANRAERKREEEAQLNKRASSWKDFQNNKKAPLMHKKDSLPVGKAGVGKTMTQNTTFKPVQTEKQKAAVSESLGSRDRYRNKY